MDIPKDAKIEGDKMVDWGVEFLLKENPFYELMADQFPDIEHKMNYAACPPRALIVAGLKLLMIFGDEFRKGPGLYKDKSNELINAVFSFIQEKVTEYHKENLEKN